MRLHKKLSIRLDSGLVERLQDHADRERVPVSYVLRHLVLRFLESEPVKQARRSVVPPPPPEKLQAEFERECCALFDGFRSQGLDVKESAKRTNFTLKAKQHPWAVYDVVSGVLRKAGRFRRQKGRP